MLVPKISPSIKPLMPSSGLYSSSKSLANKLTPPPGPGVPAISADASALYLASKSNYQNILEGTHLPGVSYPEALAENLSSKRTSHKIAEQGRRNRINTGMLAVASLEKTRLIFYSSQGDRSSITTESASKWKEGEGE
jgi:hypothetical protein